MVRGKMEEQLIENCAFQDFGKMTNTRDRAEVGRRDWIFGFRKGNYVREFPS